MKIVKTYSHLNGLEYLLVHKKALWAEVERVIDDIDAAKWHDENQPRGADARANEVQPERPEPRI